MSETTVRSPETELAPRDTVNVYTNPVSIGWYEAADVEAEIFIENEYVTSATELALEYEKYIAHTEFVSVSRNGSVEGSTRLIFYGEESGFKTLSDLANGRLELFYKEKEFIAGLPLAKTFEVGTLAVTKTMRGKPGDEGRLAVQLYGAIYAESVRHDTPYALASFDEEYLNRFKDLFGPGVRALGPAIDYMGSPTVPVIMDLPRLYDYLRENFQEVHKMAIAVANSLQHD